MSSSAPGGPAPLDRRAFLAAAGLGGLSLRLGGTPAAAHGTAAGATNGIAAAPAAATPFGLTNSGGFFTVSTGAGLVFKIRQSNGDMTSINFNGTEIQNQSTFSQVESGLGTATVTASQSGNTILVTATTTAWYGSGTLHHYMVAVNGQNNIYMATFVGTGGAGELRWITRLNRSVINTMLTPADILTGTAIESSDIFLVNGQTRSKYYSGREARSLAVRGVSGGGIGVFMAYGNRESSSGGPFFRDIEQQGTSDTQLYNYLWSAHNQPEAQRLNVLYGPYALMLVSGTGTPASPDMSFLDSFGFAGQVPASGRGFVVGKAMGVTAGMPSTVGFASATAQYWCTPDAGTGNFSSPAMKPGSYTQTLFQNELPVATRTVNVSAGTTTTGQNITSAFVIPASPVFRIGDWDGTPNGFLNFPNVTSMHPSDTRLASWGPVTFVVGSSPASAFPAYQWKDVNNPTTIRFQLSSAQIAARTVRVGLTAAYAGGRPQITVNNFTSPIPSPTTQPSSRSLTIGTYRGNNTVLTYNVPASAFVTGTNTMTLTVVSGSSGSGFLSPGVSYDCVEMF